MGEVIGFRPRAKAVSTTRGEADTPSLSRGTYHALDRVLKSVAGQGTKECRTMTRKADGWLSIDLGDEESNAATKQFRVSLRARCALCPKRCKKALNPHLT